MTTKLFSELGISAELLKAIDKLGFEQASPIQAEAIPVLLQGLDVVGQSQTGSGKTAAFAVPAIEKVDPLARAVQVLILCPTRELAIQVSEEFHKLTLFKRGIHALPIYGGQSYERQYSGLRQGAQIVIGTPGRVMDHMRRGTLRLDRVKMVILDEADVMLDMGFREDIEVILQGVPKERQTVFFCATLPRPIQELIQNYARDPRQVRIERKEMTVPTVEQVYYEVDRRFKIELLTRLIDLHDLKLGIIFCNTKRMVDDLVDHLEAQGYSADRLHGDMTQAMRDRVMNKFRKSGLEFLVATDVAARGIDVENVEVVFNYDLPYDVEDYVHRIGRTGRAGRSGRAISFVSGRELFQIHHIERFTRVKIPRRRAPSAAEVEDARTNMFLDKLRATLQRGEFKRQDHLVERLLEEGFNSTDLISALLHHLQAGEGAPAAPASREEPYSRPERAPFAERRDRREDRPDRRDFDRPREPVRKRPPLPAATPLSRPVQPSPGEKPPGESSVSNAAAPQPPAPPSRPAKAATPPPPVQPLPVEKKPEAPAVPKASPASTSPAPASQPVLASEPPQKKPPVPVKFFERRKVPAVLPGNSPKHSRRTPTGQTRLYMNVGGEMAVTAADVVQAILGETGLPASVVGAADIRERHLFVDVAAEHANSIIAKLNRTRLKNHKLKVKIA